MMKYITMQNFLQNPSGKASAGFARRDLIIANMVQRYQTLISKHKSFKYKVYQDKDDYIFYFNIPSEEYGITLMYDVVIKFVCSNPNLMKGQGTINSYSVNVFSNSPNFLFTYAHIYNKDGIVPEILKKKIGLKALDNPPIVKNPTQTYGFEKSVYFALLFIKNHGLNVKSYIHAQVEKTSFKEEIKNISHCDEKLKEYNKIKMIERQQKKEVKEKIKKIEPPTDYKKYTSGKKAKTAGKSVQSIGKPKNNNSLKNKKK